MNKSPLNLEELHRIPFQIGEWLVRPDRAELERGGVVTRLEPRSLEVLLALVAAQGATVSRAELIRAVWKGRTVSDDAVHKQLAKLRAALGDDARAPRIVETVPKLGFRLAVEVTPQTAAETATKSAAHTRRSLVWVAAALGCVILVALVLVRSPTKVPRVAGMTPLTSEPGLEIHPSLSPSGRSAVYAQRRPGSGFELRLLQLEDGVSTPLVSDTGSSVEPAWSPEGERIAFVHLVQDRCELRLFEFVTREVSKLRDCIDADEGPLAWSADGQALLYSDRSDPNEPHRILELNLTSGSARQLTQPPVGSIGDFDPVYSPDGRRVAFKRAMAYGVEDVHEIDIHTRRERRLTSEGQKVHGFDWLPGARKIVLASNRGGGTFALWSFGVDSGEWIQLGLGPDAANPIMSRDGKTLVLERWDSRVGLWEQPLDGSAPRPLVRSTHWDWWPATTPKSTQLAFVSDRSGAAEVWIAKPDASDARRLTSFRGPYTHTPSWHPAGSTLVFSAPIDGQYDLYLADVSDGSLKRLTRTAADELSPSFGADGRHIYFSTRVGTAWRLEAMTAQGSERRVIRQDVRRALIDPSGRGFYFIEPGRNGLWHAQFGAAGAELVTGTLAPVDHHNWLVDRGGIVFVRRASEQPPALYSLDPVTREQSLIATLPSLLLTSGIARSTDGRSIVYARQESLNSDLYLARLPD